MTNDLIAQAEALIEKHATSGYIHRDATLLLPGLVEEIKRLQADNDFLHKFVDDPGSTLEAALNAVREQSEVIRKQQAAFADAIKTAAATLTKWQQVAIDERAQIIQYHRGILHPLDRPSNFWESMPKDEYAECSDLAAKELGLRGYKTAYEPDGPIEINGERYVRESEQKAYVERLERLALSLCMQAGWDQEDFEAALEKIREKR